jgi:hypothetical protein
MVSNKSAHALIVGETVVLGLLCPYNLAELYFTSGLQKILNKME